MRVGCLLFGQRTKAKVDTRTLLAATKPKENNTNSWRSISSLTVYAAGHRCWIRSAAVGAVEAHRLRDKPSPGCVFRLRCCWSGSDCYSKVQQPLFQHRLLLYNNNKHSINTMSTGWTRLSSRSYLYTTVYGCQLSGMSTYISKQKEAPNYRPLCCGSLAPLTARSSYVVGMINKKKDKRVQPIGRGEKKKPGPSRKINTDARRSVTARWTSAVTTGCRIHSIILHKL